MVEQIDHHLDDLETWKHSLQHTKSSTARGSCGWAADEMKHLPDNVLTSLQHILRDLFMDGFPDFLMAAKVVPLEKEFGTVKVGKTRPITVASLIYRFWSRTIVQTLLVQWASWMPPAITGFFYRDGAPRTGATECSSISKQAISVSTHANMAASRWIS